MMFDKDCESFIISQFQTLSHFDCVTLYITLLGRENKRNMYQNSLSV